MSAIGITSHAGRYGGTYAHSDIAFEFASWISPQFKLYLIKDYQRLKSEESRRLEIGWDTKRELSRINYRIHTDAIKEFLITPELTKQKQRYTYATEGAGRKPGPPCDFSAFQVCALLIYITLTLKSTSRGSDKRPRSDLGHSCAICGTYTWGL